MSLNWNSFNEVSKRLGERQNLLESIQPSVALWSHVYPSPMGNYYVMLGERGVRV